MLVLDPETAQSPIFNFSVYYDVYIKIMAQI
jgi:hypothetical protein